MCKDCIHENVCRYKTEFENLKNEINKVTPTWAPDRYVIDIECKNFRRGTIVQRPVVDYNKLPGGNGLRNPVEKEETL
nr:MAG TPA: hypothetical protein [Caudoviricetes sp.]